MKRKSLGSLLKLFVVGITTFSPFSPIVFAEASSTPACNIAITSNPSVCYSSIQEAVSASHDGDTIQVQPGVYTVDSMISLNTPNLTLEGINNPVIQVSGTGYRFDINAAGNTIRGFNIQKIDKTGEQNIIHINANNTSILSNEFEGKYVIGDSEVSRAIITSGGYSGIIIQNNIIHDLRQPAYISGPVTGTISNNYVYKTRGWVIEQGNLTFTNNTWGTGANTNVYDIAILKETSSSYYTNISEMSEANNNAVIEDQRVSPAVLSDVYVDENTSFSSDLGGLYHPYSSITPALSRVVEGGTIHFLSDIHVSSIFNINKAVAVDGNGHTIFGVFAKTTNSNNSVIGILHDNVVLRNLTVDGSSGINLHGVNIYTAKGILLDNVTAINNNAGIIVNGSTVTVNNINTSNNSWGGINVDQGTNVTTPASLTVNGTSHQSEASAIWEDDTQKDVTVIDAKSQYTYTDYGYTRVYTLDKTAPVAPTNLTFKDTSGDILGCGSYTNQYTIVASWDASISSDVAYYEYRSYNPTSGWIWGPINVGLSTSRTGTLNGGQYTYGFAVRAVDHAGNTSEWTSQSIVDSCQISYDTTKPLLSVTSPTSNQLINTPVVIKLLASDTFSGIKNVAMHIYKVEGDSKTLVNGCTSLPAVFDGTNWVTTIDNTGSCKLTDGTYEIAAWAYDNASNPGWASRVQFVLDTTNPSGTIDGIYYPAKDTLVSKFITNTKTPTFKGTYNDENGVSSVALSLAGFNVNAQLDNGIWTSSELGPITIDGTYPLTVTITDNAGNQKVLTQDITIDTKAPTATHTYFKDGKVLGTSSTVVNNLGELSFTGNYTDFTPSSGLYWDTYSIFQAQDDGSFAFSKNGKSAYCGWRNAKNTVLLTGTDYSFDTPISFTNCISTLPEGTYYVAHQVYDTATRYDIPTINQYRDVLGLKFTIDTTSPVVELTSPISANLSGKVEIKGSVTDINPDHYWLVIQDSNGHTVAGPGTVNDNTSFTNKLFFTWDTTSVSDGLYTIKLEARDQAQNKDSHSTIWKVVTVDNTGPVLGVDTLAPLHAGVFNITGTVSDNFSGVKDLTLDFDSGNTCSAIINSGLWALEVNNGICNLSDGTYNITVTATDNNNNSTKTNITGLIIDNTLPTGESSILGAFTQGQAPLTTLKIGDNHNLKELCYTIDNWVNHTCFSVTGLTYDWDITSILNNLGTGDFSLAYYVTDEAGNQSDYNTLNTQADDYTTTGTILAVVTEQGQVQGAATTSTGTGNGYPLTEENTTKLENTDTTTSQDTTEEVKGAEDASSDTNTEQKASLPWWAYVLGGSVMLLFVIFLIARRKKEQKIQY